MISIESSDEPDSLWNSNLLKTEFATIYQTKEWAEIISNLGRTPLFLKFVNNKGKIIGQLLISITSRLARKGILQSFMRKIPISSSLLYSWSYGPIIFDEENSIYDELKDFLFLKKCKVSGTGHPFHNIIPETDKRFIIKNWSTFLIDLTKPKNELYDNIDKHSGRKNIERSLNRGVLVEEITEKSLPEYSEMVNAERKSVKGNLIDYEHLLKSWRLLKPLGYSGFLAKKDGIPIGGLLFSYLNGHIIEGGVARSPFDTKNKLYSQDLIKWKIVEWGIENKMKFYNLAGINPNPESKKEEGILRYKKKWGDKKYDYWIIRR